MSHGSEFYNLDSIPPGWTKEEFRFAVLTLEGLPREALLSLVAEFGIHFTDSNVEKVANEHLVYVILDDSDKEGLLLALQRFI